MHPRLPTEPAGTHALVVGSITWYKRPALALEVLARDFPDVKNVLLAGVADQSGAWEALLGVSRERGLSIEKRTVAHVAMGDLYADAGVVVLPSALESLGFGLSEALLQSGPVVASDIPAHREIARRVGGTPPMWIGPDGMCSGLLRDQRQATLTEAAVRSEWERVAEAMAL